MLQSLVYGVPFARTEIWNWNSTIEVENSQVQFENSWVEVKLISRSRKFMNRSRKFMSWSRKLMRRSLKLINRSWKLVNEHPSFLTVDSSRRVWRKEDWRSGLQDAQAWRLISCLLIFTGRLLRQLCSTHAQPTWWNSSRSVHVTQASNPCCQASKDCRLVLSVFCRYYEYSTCIFWCCNYALLLFRAQIMENRFPWSFECAVPWYSKIPWFRASSWLLGFLSLAAHRYCSSYYKLKSKFNPTSKFRLLLLVDCLHTKNRPHSRQRTRFRALARQQSMQVTRGLSLTKYSVSFGPKPLIQFKSD